jgi:hypothetical protein
MSTSNTALSTAAICDCAPSTRATSRVESDVLDTCSPQRENLKLKFARTLRTNYQALGDSDAVNKAILVELNATRVHLSNAWRSNEPYYRKKYAGWKGYSRS